jgi:hypothetical protein
VKRPLRAVVSLAVLIGSCAHGNLAQSQQHEYDAKARFLTIAPGFVAWPAESFKSPKATLQICVYGDFMFGIGLAELAQLASVNGHHVGIKRIHRERIQELPGCQILFVSRSEAKSYDKVLSAVKECFTLTVGEDANFLRAGGMLNLQATETGVVFDVNLDAVNDGGLKLSSQLLSLARHIVRRTESAKG